MKEIYVFSGLGADERVFTQLDLSCYQPTFIQWMPPQPEEPIENYARRLAEEIKTTRPILIGLSFGGLIAIEVAKQIETEKVILISSAKTRCEIPFYYRMAGQLSLHKLLPVFLLKNVNFFTYWLFGTPTKAEKILLKNIINDTDPTFLKWAIHEIVTWRNQTQLVNLKHIHGTADRILPLRFMKVDQEIQEGGHLMVLNHREEINDFFKKEII